jgi:hypothetical protein
MAIEQTTRHQVACKLVDLRVLMPGAQTKFGRADQPVAAEDIDNRAQVRKLKAWAIQQKRKDALERQLSKYYREVEILASISHVRRQNITSGPTLTLPPSQTLLASRRFISQTIPCEGIKTQIVYG